MRGVKQNDKVGGKRKKKKEMKKDQERERERGVKLESDIVLVKES